LRRYPAITVPQIRDGIAMLLRATYDDVLDTITAGGATVVWLNAPCSQFVPSAGRGIDLPDAFDPARSRELNAQVLEPLADEREEIAGLFDLDRALCPGGPYTNTIDGVEGIRVDGIHFSVDGALWFADKYADELFEMGGL